MRSIKKFLTILLGCFFVFSFVGCSDGGDNGGGNSSYTFNVNKTEITLEVGETFQIVASYGQEQINYSVTDNTTATVSSTGLVSAVKVGVTYVNIVAGDKPIICKVNVVENEYTVTLNKLEINMTPETVLTVKATSYKNNVEYVGTITWSVTEGATIIPDGDSVTFTATEQGTYTLVAKSEKGATASCVITVGENLGEFLA